MLERADQVLTLRRQGKSFGAIARATGLGCPKAAYDRYRHELLGDTLAPPSAPVTPVSQFDISEFVGDLFHGQAVTRNTLIVVARSRGARPAVVDVLRKVRNPTYRHCSDLMADVADLPSVFDPWEAALDHTTACSGST